MSSRQIIDPAQSVTSDVQQSGTEVVLTEIWSEVLQLKAVDRDQNFFELGGQSEDGMDILAKIAERLGVVLPFTALFQFPTIRELSLLIERQRSQGDLGSECE